MLTIHQDNPFRPINWRWEQARLAKENKERHGSISSLKIDTWISQASDFQTKLDNCRNDIDKWELMNEHPGIYGAYLIYRRGEDEDRHPMRFVIEARLLAGQKHNEIASLLGISTSNIEYFEKLFFNVIDKLKNTDYIMACVIGPSVQSGLTDRDYDLLWKLFGYLYGPIVLDSFIHTTARKYRPENSDEILTALSEDTKASIQRKVSIVSRTFTVNPFSQSELLNVYARLLELEKEDNSKKSHDFILQNLQIVLDKLPWKGSANNGDNRVNDKITKYDALSAELSTDELLQITAGEEIAPSTPLETLKYPEVATDGQTTK